MKLQAMAIDKNNKSYLLYKSEDGNIIRYMITHNNDDGIEIYEKVKDLNYESVIHLRKIDILNLYDTLKEV